MIAPRRVSLIRWSLRMPVMRLVVLTPNTSALSVMASVAQVAAQVAAQAAIRAHAPGSNAIPVLIAPETFIATDGPPPG
jgi:hypothetical protein